MPLHTCTEYEVGDIVVRYVASDDQPNLWGLVVVPRSRRGELCRPREWLDAPAVKQLPSPWNRTRAWEIDPLVHLHIAGDAYPGGFAQGRTLRNSATTQKLVVRDHASEHRGDEVLIRTVVGGPSGISCTHELIGNVNTGVLTLQVAAVNLGDRPLRLEYLSAFSLGGMTPFASDDAAGRLLLHRFRSAWSAEARHEVQSLEELNLERSWTGHGVRVERFGQVGSMPVNGWFPIAAIEDRAAEVTWAAELATPGTWNLEVYRRGDHVALGGSEADRLNGEWSRELVPGGAANARPAYITVTSGSIEPACERLLRAKRERAGRPVEGEEDLPIVFNEWCTSWGNPTHDSVISLGKKLEKTGVRYLVIDDGWAERPGAGFQQNGDWRVNTKAFPGGLRPTSDALRSLGLVPGLWFELEAINPGSNAWNEVTHQLHRNGVPLEVGTRRFWDFRDPWVHEFMAERVLGRLKEDGFGYVKIDYNDSIGAGVDGPESPGENLRLHLRGVQTFLAKLRREMPGLVVENCSSGGHRLESSMMALSSMSSFSDAHETQDIPLIAADLSSLVWSAQKQIWAVLRASDTMDRMTYSVAATFLGRMCLSGDPDVISPEKPEQAARLRAEHLRAGLDLYRRVAPVIRDGSFRVMREAGESRAYPTGHQVVTIGSADARDCVVVWHRFGKRSSEPVLELSKASEWRIEEAWSATENEVSLRDGVLHWDRGNDWTGGVVWLRGTPLAERFGGRRPTPDPGHATF